MKQRAYKYYNIIATTNCRPFIMNRLDTVIGNSMSKFGAWAGEEQALFIECLKIIKKRKPELVLSYLEIGANYGSHLIPVAQAFHDSFEIHAYEAQRVVFYALAGNVALNSFENVHVHHLAVAHAHGSIDIVLPRYDQNASFGSFEINKGKNQSDLRGAVSDRVETVECVAIDDRNHAPSFIKIDVEGMEIGVLNGALQTIIKHQPVIYLEYQKCGLQGVLEILKPLGYVMYDYVIGGDKNLLAIPSWLSPNLSFSKPVL